MTAVILSILALLATLYQLHLQRVHNEKSLSPLVQIDLTDFEGLLYINVQNNGVGPFIVDKLTFFKDGKSFADIQDCLELPPQSYLRVRVTESVKKVLSPGMSLQVFSKSFKETDTDIDDVRQQLAVLKLKVQGRDIYNNRITSERELSWFMRHNHAFTADDYKIN